MSLYRVKQFYWSITAQLDSKDVEIIEKFLNKEERELFNSISVYEQKHCIKVAMDMLNSCKDSNDTLARAALLHDVGKSLRKLNPFEKSIMVMLDSLTKGRLERLRRIKQVDVYYNHAEMGYNILKEKGNYDERFLYLVKNHHNNCIVGDKELNMLKMIDSRN